MVKIAKAFITNGDDSPAYWQIGNLWQVMATGVQTDNAFTLLDQIINTGPPTHTHDQDEGLYIISGKCTFNAGGHQGLVGTAGTFLSIPRFTEHSFTVNEPDTHVLNFYLPAGFEQLIIGISHPAKERRAPPPELIDEMLPPPQLADKLSEQYGQAFTLGNPFLEKPDPAKMLTKPTPGATVFPFKANAEQLASYTTPTGSWTILAAGNQTGGSYCLLEVRFRHAVVIEPRIYRDTDEMFYLLDGTMTFRLGDRIVTGRQGSFVFIPAGTLYSVRVDSPEAHCLNLHTRSGFDEVIALIGTKRAAASVVALPEGADSQAHSEEPVDEGAYQRLLEKIGLRELRVPALL